MMVMDKAAKQGFHQMTAAKYTPDPHTGMMMQGCILTLYGPPETCIIYSRSSVPHANDGPRLLVLCLKQCQLDNIRYGPAGDI